MNINSLNLDYYHKDMRSHVTRESGDPRRLRRTRAVIRDIRSCKRVEVVRLRRSETRDILARLAE